MEESSSPIKENIAWGKNALDPIWRLRLEAGQFPLLMLEGVLQVPLSLQCPTSSTLLCPFLSFGLSVTGFPQVSVNPAGLLLIKNWD